MLVTNLTLVVVAYLNNRRVKETKATVEQNTATVQETKKKVETVETATSGHNGWTQTEMILEVFTTLSRHIVRSDEAHSEFMAELHELSTAMSAHMMDGHDPIAAMTRETPKRTDGRDDPAPPPYPLPPPTREDG